MFGIKGTPSFSVMLYYVRFDCWCILWYKEQPLPGLTFINSHSTASVIKSSKHTGVCTKNTNHDTERTLSKSGLSVETLKTIKMIIRGVWEGWAAAWCVKHNPDHLWSSPVMEKVNTPEINRNGFVLSPVIDVSVSLEFFSVCWGAESFPIGLDRLGALLKDTGWEHSDVSSDKHTGNERKRLMDSTGPLLMALQSHLANAWSLRQTERLRKNKGTEAS